MLVATAIRRISRSALGAAQVLILGTIASAAEPSQPLILGHRGLMHQAPECTLSGFRACLVLRFGFEFDVRRTTDGELVCLHDATLDRTTTGHGVLARQTLEQVRQLDAGSRFSPTFREERVPRIDDILSLLKTDSHGEVLAAVDLKEAGGGLEEKIVRLAESHQVLDRLLFIGLTIDSADVRSRLKSASRKARTARLAATPEAMDAAISDRDADFVYLRFLPAADDVKRVHAAGKQTFLAGPLVAGLETANWSKAAQLGIDVILTDFPLELAAQHRQR